MKFVRSALISVLVWCLTVLPVKADYFINQGTQTAIAAGLIGGSNRVLSWQQIVDQSGAPIGTNVNPLFFNFTSGATLPSFGTAQHFICDSGCSGGGGGGVSVTFGGAIGTLGTPNGYKDGSGNFQPILGDATNGQWVAIKSSVGLSISNFPATQPISAASLPLPTGASTSALQTTGNTSLATIAANTPALGQALAAASSPVVLTAAQIATLTPLSSVTVTQGTGTNLHVVCDSGCAAGSGAITAASGSFAAGALSAGAGVDGWDLTQGTTTDSAATSGSTGTASAKLRLMTTQLNNIVNSTSAIGTATGNTATNIGAPGATACTTDTASCSTNQQMQRLAQRLTSLVTALGTPFQAGGSIGNTSFAATQSGTWTMAVSNANANGQATAAASSPVVLATDQLPIAANYLKGATAAMTGTAATQIIAAVASKVIYVNFLKCNNSSASVPTLVQITDGSGGTVLKTLACNDNFNGEVNTASTPLTWTTSGNGLYAQDVTTGASVIVEASGWHN